MSTPPRSRAAQLDGEPANESTVVLRVRVRWNPRRITLREIRRAFGIYLEVATDTEMFIVNHRGEHIVAAEVIEVIL